MPAVGPILQKNYEATPYTSHFYPTKAQISRRFVERYPDFLHTCSVKSPFPPVNEGYFFVAFSPGTCDSLWLKYRGKTLSIYIYIYIWGRKNYIHTPFVNGLKGAHRTRVQHFRMSLLKTAWTTDAEHKYVSVGSSLNQPVRES